LSLLGDFAIGFVLLTSALWVFAIIGTIVNRQIFFALLLLLVLVIPLSTIAYEYFKTERKREPRVKKGKRAQV